MPKALTYFVSDVHLGLQVGDPAAREQAFVAFLQGIDPAQTESLYLLGDIWDFWYEYRDVVPKGYVKVLSALVSLMEAGVKVYFFQGNHDIWTYHYFEELGMTRLVQPYVVQIGTEKFCLGHGDGLGPGRKGYKVMRWVSSLHPWLAFRMGNGWSRRSRLGKNITYTFKGASEPLYRFCEAFPEPVQYFIFGHYHARVDLPLVPASGADSVDARPPRLVLLGDWITAPNWLVYDADSGELTACHGR